MKECDNNCENCTEDCEERKAPFDFRVPSNKFSDIKKVIGVISGKGGVGKSLVACLLAVSARRRGFETAILDADITGPSIPKVFGLTERASAGKNMLFPVKTKTGIKVMSINLLLEDDTQPVIWRGPILSGTVKQFWSDVVWEKVDFMFVDMPPGTGDIPLTVFQSLPVNGIIVVTSPQELVSMIVGKAASMARKMNIPILGIAENFSYFQCPNCHKTFEVYGKSRINEVAKQFGIQNFVRIPIDPELSASCDRGTIEDFKTDYAGSLLFGGEK